MLASGGFGHRISVHLDRLRNPSGAALLAAIILLLVVLFVLRRRRQRNLAAARDRNAATTSGSGARGRRSGTGIEEARKSLRTRATEFVRRHRRPDLAQILEPYRLIPMSTAARLGR